MLRPKRHGKWQMANGKWSGVLAFAIFLLPFHMPLSAATLPATLGWYQIPNTAMQPNGIGGAGDQCPSSSYGGYGYAYDDNCDAVFNNWSGGSIDQANNRLVVWGGGHTGYAGNEIYALTIGTTPSFKRLGPPSQPQSNVEVLSNPFGPNSRHTYGGLAYIEHAGKMFMGGGCLYGGNCPRSRGEWILDLNSVGLSCAAQSQTQPGCTPAWTEIDTTLSGVKFTNYTYTDLIYSDYYQSDRNVYMYFPSEGVMLAYNYDTNTQSLVKSGVSAPSYQLGVAIEQTSGIFIYSGNGSFGGFQLPGGTRVDHSGSSGCGPVQSAYDPGYAYDEVAKQVIVYPGSGQTVYAINTNGSNTGTWTCTAETLGSTTPPAGTSNGPLGRFRYLRSEDAFLYCPGTDRPPSNTNCWSYRRRSSAPPPPTSSPCDINGDGFTNVVDVQVEVNMALGISSCTNASGTCNVVSIQRVVNAALGGTCVSP